MGIGSAGVMGMMRRELATAQDIGWVTAISGPEIPSTSPIETYPFIGNIPQMREWIGGRQTKEFREHSIEVANSVFETSIPVDLEELDYDKTGLLRMRIADLMKAAPRHWAQHLSTLIATGESLPCYDGSNFFATDHNTGDSGDQSNLINVDISALGALVHGTTTNPSPEEVQGVIAQGIQAIVGFKDEHGEPRNDGDTNFLIMSTHAMQFNIQTALSKGTEVGEGVVDFGGVNLSYVANPRLSSLTEQIFVFSISSMAKPFLRQQKGDVMIKAKAEQSDYAFDNNAHQYGVNVTRKGFLAYWDKAVRLTMT